MRRSTTRFALCGCLLVLTSCSSGGGIFQPPKASGTINARVLGTSTRLATTFANPLTVHNGFSIVLDEDNYSAQFTATIVSFTAPATQSCYTVAMDSTGTVATFTPRSAPAISGSSGPSPCTPPSEDVESVLFQDQQSHSAQQYFKNQ